MGAPQEVASGVEALKRVTSVLPNAMPLVTTDQFGAQVRIEAGTVWGGNRMFVTDLGGTVVYSVGDKLYTQSTRDFVRDTYLIALGDGAKKAEWMVGVAQAEMTFIMALAGTLAGGLGTVAALGTAIAKVATFVNTNKAQVAEAKKHLATVLGSYHFLASKCPKLGMMLGKMMGGFALKSISEGVGAGDIAYFFGKLLGGIGKAPEVTIGVVVKALGMAVALTAAIHGPSMSAHGASTRAKDLAQNALKNGVNVPEADVLLAEAEGCLKKPEVRAKLVEMFDAAKKAQPVVEGLAKAMSQNLAN